MKSNATSDVDNAGLLRQFTDAFVHDDIELLFTLLAPDCQWIIVPSGERFVGLDEIRVLTEKVRKARTHSEQAKPGLRDAFSDAEHLCLEFLHRGIVTQGFDGTAGGPAAGSIFEIDFCVTALVSNGKITRVREYFDHTQLATPPTKRVKFFS